MDDLGVFFLYIKIMTITNKDQTKLQYHMTNASTILEFVFPLWKATIQGLSII